MESSNLIGGRIQEIRRERGWSQEGIAERAGMSARFVRKIEAGDATPSVDGVFRLAAALGVEPGRLMDRRERLGQAARDSGILAIRDVILTLEDLPGDPPPPAGVPVPLPDLERDVAAAWDLYWKGHLGLLAARLPGLIAAARATERDAGTPACKALAQSCQIAADLMVHMGDDNLAYCAARSALRAAHRGDDPLQYATLWGTMSWVMLHQGRLAEAEQAAARAADGIRPAGKAPMEHLTVHGALLLSAAAPAAAAGKADAVAGYFGEAAVTALHFTQGDRHDYNASYGPTQVAMQQAHTQMVLHEPAAALKAAKRVRRGDLLTISWGAHHLDVAQACLDMRPVRVSHAEDALWTAHHVSPEWSRHQGPYRDLVAMALRARRSRSERIEKLAREAQVW